jgi:hypothetical protein
MRGIHARPQVNTNPFAFEELATSLASLNAFMQDAEGDMNAPIQQFTHLYQRALRQPPGYAEITELGGPSIGAGDRRAGQGAWLLLNVAKLHVCGVFSRVWHNVGSKYAAPMLSQLAKVLGVPSQLTEKDLQALGATSSLLSVLGVKDGRIWLVQTAWEKQRLRSALQHGMGGAQASLFDALDDAPTESRVFDDPVIEGKVLTTLYAAYDVLRRAFPSVGVDAFGLIMHPSGADFELYGIDVADELPNRVVLARNRVLLNSLDFADRLIDDQESLLMLPARLQDGTFRGLPPCRGSRTLMLLSATARRQMSSEGLLMWREKRLKLMLKQDYEYDVTRDKVRHDLVDRLLGQGFMKKWGNTYYLMPKGIARYLYSLAKYTMAGGDDPMVVLDECTKQRNRIVGKFGYLI